MKLTDLKITKAERKEREKGMNATCGPMGDGDYGYGLRITLNDHELKKLGIDSLPKAGKEVRLEAQALVISVRSNSSSDRGEDRAIELQLRKIGLDIGGGSVEDAVRDGIKDV